MIISTRGILIHSLKGPVEEENSSPKMNVDVAIWDIAYHAILFL